MEKRSPKLPAVSEKMQLGCLWGLIGFFDLHQSRPNQKLISNKRHVNKHTGTKHPESQPTHGRAGNKNLMVNTDERSLRKLIAGEVSTKQVIKKQRMTSEMQRPSSDSELVGLAKTRKKAGKTLQKSYQLSSHHCQDAGILVHQEHSDSISMYKSSNKYSSTAMLEACCSQIHLEDGRNHSDVHRGIACTKYDQVVQMRSGALTDQMFVDRKYLIKNGASHQARHFLGALEIINWNKELFLELLQDPNSLLVNQIRQSRDSQAREENTEPSLEATTSKGKTGSQRNLKKPAHSATLLKKSMHHFFWKRIRSQHTNPSKRIETGQPVNRLEVFKPALQSKQVSENMTPVCSPLHSQHLLRNKGKNQDVNATFLTFKNIKRMLRPAIRESQKEQDCTSMNGAPGNVLHEHQGCKFVGVGIGQETSSKLTSKSFTVADLGSNVSKSRDLRSIIRPEVINGSVCKRLNPSDVNNSKQKEFDTFMEAKKHICDRLSKLNRGDMFLGKQPTRTLERILSSPEHSNLLATLSPKRDVEHDSVSSQIRFSPHRNSQMAMEFDGQLYNTKPYIKETLPDTEVNQKLCSVQDDTSSNGCKNIPQNNNSIQAGDLDVLEVPSEPISVHNSSTILVTETPRLWERDGISVYSKSEANFKNQALESSLDVSPSSPLSIYELEAVNCINDEKEQPSPVSVLKPFLINDVTSPTNKTSPPAEPLIQQLHFDFGEPSHVVQHLHLKVNTATCMNEQESMSAYIRAMLQASGLTLEELLLKRPSSEQLLQTSMFNEVPLFPTECHCDPNLLFDFINEVLWKVYQSHLGCYPWISFLKPKISTVPVEEIVVDEVMREVNFYLLPQMEPPTLEQLVEKDVAKSGTWIDIQLNTENIVIEIVDDVLEGTVIEAIAEIQI